MGTDNKTDGKHDGKHDDGPDFDIALWGYDRKQVQRCLDRLTEQLEHALGQLDSVEELQAELGRANVEIAELRQHLAENPPWADRLSTIMAAAEQLRGRAADRAGDPAGDPVASG